jgi:catechol 2,3-dioxygenase-like lactoylglutathione lyase family enzyme
MLGDKQALATIAVKDLAVAKKFYEGVLGLKQVSAQGNEAITYKSGSSNVLVYRSQFAGTNQATAANWQVGNEIEKVVQGLKERGVTFEHYDLPPMTRQGRPAPRRRPEGRLVQGPGRQHPRADQSLEWNPGRVPHLPRWAPPS